jgi:hypothetical protein
MMANQGYVLTRTVAGSARLLCLGAPSIES